MFTDICILLLAAAVLLIGYTALGYPALHRKFFPRTPSCRRRPPSRR
jgi:hypothetical protein